MGISKGTALEIFTNPADLEITVTQEKEGAKFAIGIFRGPGHNMKPLISSGPYFDKAEEAIECIKQLLGSICESISPEFNNYKSHIAEFLNPQGQKLDKSQVLSTALAGRIVEELQKNRAASTYKIIPLWVAETKEKASALNADLQEAETERRDAEIKISDIQKRIVELQEQCPHQNIKEDSGMDVMEMKSYRFCADCGALR